MDFPPFILNRKWAQRGLLFSLGALGALAFPPFYIFPALLLALSCAWVVVNRMIEEEASLLHLFSLGWWFGLGHFTLGLYWIAWALTVEIETFWWLIPFALLGIPSILSIFTGLGFLSLRFWPYRGLSRGFAFAGMWVIVEWARGHIFTGFPWNLAGYSWGFNLDLMQTASLIGVYGMSLFTALLAVCLGYLFSRKPLERNIALGLYLSLALFWLWGNYRLQHTDFQDTRPINIRIVQPNIPQTLKWDAQQQDANFKRLLQMTVKATAFPLQAIIWPETAVPFFLEQDGFRRDLIANIIPEGVLLFTGGLRRTPYGEEPPQVWNSLLVFNGQGEMIAAYDKSHLVPFGEYLPFRETLDSIFGKGTIKKVTAGTVDFSGGPGPQTIALPEPFPPCSGLVCYEVIFPKAVVNLAQGRPGWIINVTNDAWYGMTSGPYQHLEISRFRAIEEGIPLVRAANSGISAAFDGYGRTLGMIGLGKQGILDTALPPPTEAIPLYSRWGDWILFGLLLITFACAWAFSFRERKL